ncbi:antitoxin VbhA family protein [Bacterioplanoides sp.]
MRTLNHTVIRRKTNSAVGSMAIEGIVVSRKTKTDMLRIATGKTTAAKVKQKLIAQYCQS